MLSSAKQIHQFFRYCELDPFTHHINVFSGISYIHFLRLLHSCNENKPKMIRKKFKLFKVHLNWRLFFLYRFLHYTLIRRSMLSWIAKAATKELPI